MSGAASYDDVLVLPRAVRFPVEMIPPPGFDAERLESWPSVVGRLEFVEGKLLYMPPSGDRQQDTATDIVIALGAWVRRHPELVLGANEAGMRLAGATRAAGVAVWRRRDLGPYTGGLRRVPPVLAIEIAGVEQGDSEEYLRDKAAWYRGAGVEVVWLLFPESREVVVISQGREERFSGDMRIAPHDALPGLEPLVSELFRQLSAGD